MNDLVTDLRERLQDWIESLHFTPIHKRALIIAFAVVCVVSVAVVARGHSQPIVEVAPIVVEPPKVMVDVAGGVKKPGLYELPANSRVMDAITAAGGTRPGTNTSDINLARIIKDGEQIYVEPLVTTNSNHVAGSTRVLERKAAPININRATATELDTLPGIGPVIASRIIDYRKTNGPFASVDDLQKVSGIGVAKFAQFKSKVRV
jgi:competence protein ComEA